MILGGSEMQLPIIKKAREIGLSTLVIDKNPLAPGLKESEFGEVVDTTDKQGALAVAKKYQVKGITTLGSDAPVRTIAFLGEKLGLPGIREEVARAVTDKGILRKRLKKLGLPQPCFREVELKSKVKSQKSKVKSQNLKLKFPVVVKPVNSWGSRGVKVVEEIESLPLAISEAKEYSSQRVIIEERLEGKEVSVESLTRKGKTNVLSITEKILTPPPYCVEIGHIIPAKLSLEEKESIENLVKRVIKLLGIDNSPSHIEIKLTKEGPQIVEVGARLGGGYITSHLLPLATGIDILRATLFLSLGKPFEVKPLWKRTAGISFLTPPPGKVKKVSGKEEAERYKGIEKVSISLNPGDIVRRLRSSKDRIGFIIACGENRKEVLRNLNQAKGKIKIEIDEGSTCLSRN